MKYYIIISFILFSCSPSVPEPELDYDPVGDYSLEMYSYSVDLTNIKDDKARVALDCQDLIKIKSFFIFLRQFQGPIKNSTMEK